MRIIAGIHRSRRILPPDDSETTRPITDRVKQSLFDRLTSAAAFDGYCLDIFAGTGSLGLEALSRGMEHCTFIERDRSARERLDRNLVDLKLEDQAAVLSLDAFAASWATVLPHRPVHLIFCDPPYRMTNDEEEMTRVMKLIASLAAVAAEGALLVLRTETPTKPPAADGWIGPESFGYGSQTLHFFEKHGASEA